jgi:hypothetical protein
MEAFVFLRAGENEFSLRSRIAQRLDVRGNVRLAVSLAAALGNLILTSPSNVTTINEVMR